VSLDDLRSFQEIEEVAERMIAESPPLDAAESERLRKEFRLDDLANRLARTKDYEGLFSYLVSQRLALSQARHFGGFQQTSRDLESFGLTVAAEQKDWIHFFLFAGDGLQYRSLAGVLSDPAVLEALLQYGSSNLARDVWMQLPKGMSRARAAAIVVSTTEDPIDELDTTEPPTDRESAERWLEILDIAAARWAQELGRNWPHWIKRLAWSDLRQDGWLKVAEGWRAEGWDDKNFLRIVEGLGARAGAVLTRLADSALCHLPRLLELLKGQPAWRQLEGQLGLLQLSHRVIDGRSSEEEAMRWLAAFPFSWAPELVEAGRLLWPQSSIALIDAMRDLLRGSAAASFELILLRAQAPTAERARLFAVLNTLEDERAKIHGYLQWLRIPGDPCRRKEVLLALARHFFHSRYEPDEEDWVTLLDQVAELLPGELSEHLEGALRSLAFRSGDRGGAVAGMLLIAQKAESPLLLELLFEDAERWTALAGRDESEGLALRAKVLRELGQRLICSRPDDDILGRISSRALRSEEDALREVLALALSGDNSKQAEEIAELINDEVLKLRTKLRVLTDGDRLRLLVEPESLLLVAKTRSCRRIREEFLALGVLLVVPSDVVRLAERLKTIQDTDRKVLATFELVEHALRFQQQAYKPWQRDFAGAIRPLEEALESGGSEGLQLGLIPELVSLSQFGPRSRELVEWREAWLKTLRFSSVPWPRRVELLERLLFDLLRVMEVADTSTAFQRSNAVSTALCWACRLPLSLARDDEAVRVSRKHGDELVALLMAAEETGWMLGRLHSRPGLAVVSSAPLLKTLESLEGPRRRAVEMALTSAHERGRMLDEILREGDGDSRADLWRVILPLARNDPARLPTVLGRLDEDARRDAGLRLARSGYLADESWGALEQAFEELGEKDLIRVWRGVRRPSVDGEWLRSLAEVIARGGLDSKDPANLPIIRRLRMAERTRAVEELAGAVPKALARGGELAGEHALFLWLRAYLSSKLGVGNRTAADHWKPELEKVL